MPGVHPSPSRHLMTLLTDFGKRLTKLEHQQNTTIANAKGQAVLNLGLIPPIGAQTSAEYGLQMLNPGTGNVGTPVLQLGQQADGTYGLYLFGTTGEPLMKLNTTGLILESPSGVELIALTDTGLTVYDSTGKQRAMLGLLPSGDYGLAVQDPTGHSIEVWPPTAAYGNLTGTVSSTTPVAASGAPSVTAYFGASGDAIVTIGSYIGTPLTGGSGLVYLSIDGGAANEFIEAGTPSAGVAENVSSTRRLSQWLGVTLTPNTSHTFSLEFSSTSGNPTTFAALSILVQPI